MCRVVLSHRDLHSYLDESNMGGEDQHATPHKVGSYSYLVIH